MSSLLPCRFESWPAPRHASQRRPVNGSELVLVVVAERSGAHVDEQRVAVNLDDAADTAHVKRHAAEQRDRAANATASTAAQGDRDPSVVADRQDRRHYTWLHRGRPVFMARSRVVSGDHGHMVYL